MKKLVGEKCHGLLITVGENIQPNWSGTLLILSCKNWMIGFIVFFSQTLFNIFKVLEIKYTYQNRVTDLLINSIWINIVSLTSVYFSIESLLNGDFWIIFFYISGSVLGKYVGMKLGNPRYQIWKRIFKEKKRKETPPTEKANQPLSKHYTVGNGV